MVAGLPRRAESSKDLKSFKVLTCLKPKCLVVVWETASC